MMKQFFLLLFALLTLSSVHAQDLTSAQADTLAADSVLNVIAWFNKNDTLVYTEHAQNFHAENGDTTLVSDETRRFRFIVADSTSRGFLLSYEPLSFHTTDSLVSNALKNEMAKRFLGIRILFSTDELGHVKQIENHQEVRREVLSRCDSMVNEIYKENPLLYGQMSKPDMLKKVHKMLDETYGSRQRLLEKMEALTLLFSNHGKCFPVGVSKGEKGNTRTRLDVTLGKMDDEDDTATDDDYQIASQVYQITSDVESHFVVIATDYFSDGWPRYCFFKMEDDNAGLSEITSIEIEWEYRGWEY